MDFFQKQYTQVVDLLKTFTPAGRVTAGLLALAVMSSFVYLVVFQAPSSSEEYLFGGREFSQSELAAMETAFASGGLGGAEIVGNRLRVPRGRKGEYLAALAEANVLPDDFTSAFDKVFDEENPFSSKSLREAKLQNAKEKLLSLVITKMKGVAEANVRFDVTPRRGLAREVDVTAYAAVKPLGNQTLDEGQVRAIRNTVAAAVAGLKRENVTVTDLNAGVAHAGDGADGEDNAYAVQKARYEGAWRDKIRQILTMYPGAVVEVNVELDPEVRRQEQSRQYDPKPVTLQTAEFRRNSTNSTDAAGDRVGAVPNTSLSNTAARVGAGSTTQAQVDESRAEQQMVASVTSTDAQRVGLAPRRVTASIGIPHSYLVKVWNERAPPAAGAQPKPPEPVEIAKIEAETKDRVKELVVGILPELPRGDDPYPQVTVTTFTDLPMAAAPGPTLMDWIGDWLAAHWTTVGMLALGAASLWFVRGVIRAPHQEPIDTRGGPLVQVNLTADDMHHEPGAAAPAGERSERGDPDGLRRFGEGGANLRSELVDLVRSDVEAAAKIVGNWIGDAA